MPDNQTGDTGRRTAHEMRPCPFCGCSTSNGREGPGLHIFGVASPVDGFMAGCFSCGAHARDGVTRAEALAAWNRRADDEDAAPGPDWEGFARLIMTAWPMAWADPFDIEGAAEKHGLLRRVPGGFDPARHADTIGCCAPGDPWLERTYGPRDAA